MLVYSFQLQKGGVGRSSISSNVSYICSEQMNKIFQKYKICLIDGDVQGNSTSYLLNPDTSIKYELVDILKGKVSVKDSLIKLSSSFYLIPTITGSTELAIFKETQLFREPFLFEDINSELEKLDFDLVIYDTSPGTNQMERSICLSCQSVISVMKPEYFSLDGLEIHQSFIQDVNKSYRKNVQNEKLVMNMVNRSVRAHRINLERAKSLDYELFVIPQDVNIEKSQEYHKPLMKYNPSSRAVKPLQKLTDSLIGGIIKWQ